MANLRTSLGRAAAAVAVLAATSCGSSATETATAPDTTSAATAEAVEATAAPSLAERVSVPLESVSGSQFDLGSLEGKDTVLWFWAPW